MSRRLSFSRLPISQGALIILGLNVGLSLVYMMCDDAAKLTIMEWLLASPSQVFGHGKVWTLATTTFLEPQFFNLLLDGLMMFLFVPTLERFWGTARFYRFFAATMLLGNFAGVAVGQLAGVDFPILGLSPFIWGTVIAYGIVYARQPVQIFGVLPLTGRQMMWGFIVFLAFRVLVQQMWFAGASYAGGMITGFVMVSKRFSPGLAWKRWKLARARSKLTVIQGGTAKPKRDEQKWLN